MQDARRAGAGARHIDLTADRAGRDGARHGEAPINVAAGRADVERGFVAVRKLDIAAARSDGHGRSAAAGQLDIAARGLQLHPLRRGMLHFDVTAGRMDAQLALDGGAELDIAAGAAEHGTVKGQAAGNLDLAGAGLCPEHPVCARREIDAQRIVPHWDVEQLVAADAEVERQADTMAAQLLNVEHSARHGGGAALLLLKLHAADAILRRPKLHIGTDRVDLDCVERIGKQQEAAGGFDPLGLNTQPCLCMRRLGEELCRSFLYGTCRCDSVRLAESLFHAVVDDLFVIGERGHAILRGERGQLFFQCLQKFSFRHVQSPPLTE